MNTISGDNYSRGNVLLNLTLPDQGSFSVEKCQFHDGTTNLGLRIGIVFVLVPLIFRVFFRPRNGFVFVFAAVIDKL